MKRIICFFMIVILFAGFYCPAYAAHKTRSDSAKSKENYSAYPAVVIDAGHGGIDPGAVVENVKEKDINLDIVKRLNKILTKKGIKTYMTRKSDRFVDKYERAEIANNKDAGLLVSIHSNSDTSKMRGTMTLFCPSRGKDDSKLTSRSLASIIQNSLVKAIGSRNLGIIPRRRLAVLRTSEMPAVIVEVGYLSNKTDRRNLSDAGYRQKVAESLAKSIIKALKKM